MSNCSQEKISYDECQLDSVRPQVVIVGAGPDAEAALAREIAKGVNAILIHPKDVDKYAHLVRAVEVPPQMPPIPKMHQVKPPPINLSHFRDKRRAKKPAKTGPRGSSYFNKKNDKP